MSRVAQAAFRVVELDDGLISGGFQRLCAPPSAGLVSLRTNLELMELGGQPVSALVDTTQMGV